MATILLAEDVRMPTGISSLSAFRRWARSDAYPTRGWFAYLGGEIFVDLDMEQLFIHNLLKGEYAIVVGGLVKRQKRGYYFHDRAFLSNVDADLSTEPDGMYVSFESVRLGRVRLVRAREGGFVEITGSPDMALEVVSDSSERKDTEILHELYALADVTEYWVVDAREAPARFDIFRLGSRGYTAVRKQADGWLKSKVFGKSFQMTQHTDPLGHPQFVLATND